MISVSAETKVNKFVSIRESKRTKSDNNLLSRTSEKVSNKSET